MVVLLTGATGFLGKYLLEDFSSHELKVITRSPEKIDNPAIEVVKADISGKIPTDIFENVKVFIHSAAKVGNWPKDPMKGFHQTNVVATQNLIEMAIKAEVPQIIYTSSYFALGPTGDQIPDENWDRPPGTNHPYVTTKYEAGKIVDELAKDYPIMQILPTVIIGPGIDNIIADILIDFINGKLVGVPGGGKNWFNFVSADDVARAHLIGAAGNYSGKYLIGHKNMQLIDFISLFADKLQIKPPRSVPFWAASVYAKTLELLGNRKMTTNDVEIARNNYRYNCDKSKELGLEYKKIDKIVDSMIINFLHSDKLNRKGEKRVLEYLNSQ